MQRSASLFLVCLLLSQLLPGQATHPLAGPAQPEQQAAQPAAPQQQQQSQTSNFTSAKGFVLEDAIPVRLRFNRTVSSADAHVGDTVDFEVLQDVSVNGTLVVPKGGMGVGTVAEAQPKRRMARGGKLEINVDYVKLRNGDKAALRAVKGGNGGGHTAAMTAGIVATGIVFFPAAPFFLFIKGKDITLPKGAEFTAYINGDMTLDLAKFQPPAPAAPQSDLSARNSSRNDARNDDQNIGATSSKLQIESTPPGADIEVDGSYVGNTPSDVQVAEGDHLIVVRKPGFKNWERKLKSTSGSNVHLVAEMEKTPDQ